VDKNGLIIIGAGPVGLATALHLAKHGYQSTVFEGRMDIPSDPEESYPIGVNARGLRALEAIDSTLSEQVKQSGMIIDSWQIFGGSKMVAKMSSGVVYGTSRGKVNLVLYEAAKKNPKINIKFGYKLIEINFSKKELTFTRSHDKSQEIVQVNGRRIVAADGVNSIVRQSLLEKTANFNCTIQPWTNEFRVLFAPPGAEFKELDTRVHYIFSGCYTATIDNCGQQQWTCVMGARDNASPKEKELLLSKVATPDNIQSLRKLISQRAPRVLPFFETDKELTRYFQRRTYRGAIIKCNRLNDSEFILLLGDAAHSVLPPTGEGINSGLEDTLILADIVKENPERCFQLFNERRIADVHALHDYAEYLNSLPVIPGEGGARLMFMILESILAKTGIISAPISEHLFGPTSAEVKPYNDIISVWKKKRCWLLPICRVFCYPFAFLMAALCFPCKLFTFCISRKQS